MASSASISIALGLALAIGAAAVTSAQAARTNGGPSGSPGGPTGGQNPSHDSAPYLQNPQACKTWQYVIVDGVRKHECKVYQDVKGN